MPPKSKARKSTKSTKSTSAKGARKSTFAKSKSTKSKSTKLSKQEMKHIKETLDYSESSEDELVELDDVPDLYDVDPDSALKERYAYKPVVRQEIVYLTKNNRRTSEIMSMFEYTEIIGHRAKQIENGNVCFTNVDGISDPIKMAEKELRDRKCPLDIIRKLSDNVAELWHANEMGFIEV